ncbi:WD repeat-containing protein 55-like [Watersipora subatra]|uniref:WD repeat-containing protein 55-like n=1 Tax=Watersipora subatra TaxID=2589382 RepID=UPI00355C8EE7
MADAAQKVPSSIECSAQPTDVCFHPGKAAVAVGDISGNVTLYSYDEKREDTVVHKLRSLENHRKAIRCVRVTPDGSHLYSAGKDKCWCRVNLETGALDVKQSKAHESAIYSVESVDQNVMISGDEDGVVKMWDMRRMPTPVMELKENDEYISDMVCHENKKHLLVTSGDGTLSCVNIKNRKLELQSELFESELLSIAIMKNNSKVVCGDGDGSLQIFNWGEWGNISDRYPGHPSSIDCMLPLSDDIMCTGCMDGKLRLVHILPNCIERTLGTHGDLPVQSLSLSHDASLIASCSHDEYIRFWATPQLENIEVGSHSKRKGKKVGKNERLKEKKEFFSDL